MEQSSVQPILPVQHGVIIPKRRAVGTYSDGSEKLRQGHLNYTPVAKVTNLAKTMEELKERGLWFVCADMGGESPVPDESDWSDRSCDWKRGRGSQPPCEGEVRFCCFHSNERGY